jgi:hypothetical protein
VGQVDRGVEARPLGVEPALSVEAVAPAVADDRAVRVQAPGRPLGRRGDVARGQPGERERGGGEDDPKARYEERVEDGEGTPVSPGRGRRQHQTR